MYRIPHRHEQCNKYQRTGVTTVLSHRYQLKRLDVNRADSNADKIYLAIFITHYWKCTYMFLLLRMLTGDKFDPILTTLAETTKTLESTSIRYRFHAFTSDRYLILKGLLSAKIPAPTVISSSTVNNTLGARDWFLGSNAANVSVNFGAIIWFKLPISRFRDFGLTIIRRIGCWNGVRGVAKPIFSVPIFSQFYSAAKALTTYGISRSYLSGVAAHYTDVTMSPMASQIISLTIVYSTVYSVADQRKHQSSASLAFVRGIRRRPVNSPHKWPVTRKMLPFGDVIMSSSTITSVNSGNDSVLQNHFFP